jgi:uncharacterized membrane protein
MMGLPLVGIALILIAGGLLMYARTRPLSHRVGPAWRYSIPVLAIGGLVLIAVAVISGFR